MKRSDLRPYVDEPTDWPRGFEKWSLWPLYHITFYFSCCYLAMMLLPNRLWAPEVREITITIGVLGIWRYGWWFTHAIRAFIYGHFIYPDLRKKGQEVWKSGWRPRHLHFMMTTYNEHRDITEKVVRSILGGLFYRAMYNEYYFY